MRTGSGQHNILSIDWEAIGDDLVVEIQFGAPVAPASLLLDESLVGSIQFDIDQLGATGISSEVGAIIGYEYYLNLYDESGNLGPLFDVVTNQPVADVAVTFGEHSASFSVSLAHLVNADGNSDDGQINLGVAIGTWSEPTDTAVAIMPGTVATVPEPGSALVWMGLALGYLPARQMMRRARRQEQ